MTNGTPTPNALEPTEFMRRKFDQHFADQVGLGTARQPSDTRLCSEAPDPKRQAAVAPLAAISVKADQMSCIGKGGVVCDVPVIRLSCEAALSFPIPVEVAADVAYAIIDVLRREGLSFDIPKDPLFMFHGQETREKRPPARNARNRKEGL